MRISFSKSFSSVSLVFLLIFISCGGKENTIRPITAQNEDVDYFADKEMEVIFERDPNGINVVYMADGYTHQDLGKNHGIYRREAIANIEYLFDQQPFEHYEQYFNAYIVYAESEDNGIDGPYGVEKNTALDLGFGDFKFGEIEFSVPVYQDRSILETYARIAVPDLDQDDLILVSAKNAGGGTGGNGIAVFGSGDERVMLHEIGHAFADLGDEYYFEDFDMDYTEILEVNLDLTMDLSIIKWSHFIGLEGYETVGAFEGGRYTPKNVWRPELISIMGHGNHFNAPSREAIVKRIYQIKSLTFNFDAFLEADIHPGSTGRT